MLLTNSHTSARIFKLISLAVALSIMHSVGALSRAVAGGSMELVRDGDVGQPGAVVGALTGPMAIVGERAVELDELRPALLEAVGGLVLSELVTDERLSRRIAEAGLTVTEADVRRERELLADSLGAAGLSPDEAQRAVDQERTRRGLGPVRFAALLRRGAMLRALVGPKVVVTDELVRQSYEIRYGEQVVVRILVTEDPAAAQRVRDEITTVWEEADRTSRGLSQAARELMFAERALNVSVDATASLGGLLEPLSPADTRYPEGIRVTARELKVGELSPAITLGTRGLLVYVRERRAAQSPPTLEAVRAEIVAQLRVGLERRAMDLLAQELEREAGVLVMDRALGWSWERRR